MVKDDRGKKFSCIKCGECFVGYPPDDFHQTASLNPNEINNPVKIEYKCPKCGNVNVLYWGSEKSYFSMV